MQDSCNEIRGSLSSSWRERESHPRSPLLFSRQQTKTLVGQDITMTSRLMSRSFSLLKSYRPSTVRLMTTSFLSNGCVGARCNIACKTTTFLRTSAPTGVVPSRVYSIYGPDPTPLDVEDVRKRVMKVCGAYDKIDASSVSWFVLRIMRRVQDTRWEMKGSRGWTTCVCTRLNAQWDVTNGERKGQPFAAVRSRARVQNTFVSSDPSSLPPSWLSLLWVSCRLLSNLLLPLFSSPTEKTASYHFYEVVWVHARPQRPIDLWLRRGESIHRLAVVWQSQRTWKGVDNEKFISNTSMLFLSKLTNQNFFHFS